jgi:hypothetical protein
VERDGVMAYLKVIGAVGLCTVQPLYTAGLSSGTSSSLPTSVVPADTRRVMVSSLYCFHASGEMESSSH